MRNGRMMLHGVTRVTINGYEEPDHKVITIDVDDYVVSITIFPDEQYGPFKMTAGKLNLNDIIFGEPLEDEG